MSHATNRTVAVAIIAAAAFAANLNQANQAAAAPLPTSGLVLALDGSGISTTGGVISGWTDENGGTPRFNGVVGSPTLGTIVTPNGSHPAASFNGSSGVALNDPAALSQQNLSVFVVANLATTNQSAEFISNYVNNNGSHGWADGISDGNANQPKWFTGPDGIDNLGNTTGAHLVPGSGANNAYLLTETISVTGGNSTKGADAANGLGLAFNQPSTPDTVPGIPYTGGEQVGVGFLNAFGGVQFLNGNIAEILVYNNSTPGFNAAAVTNYLEQKFFTPEPSSFVLLGLAGVLVAGGALNRRRAKTSG
jgi:hypothetical protein